MTKSLMVHFSFLSEVLGETKAWKCAGRSVWHCHGRRLQFGCIWSNRTQSSVAKLTLAASSKDMNLKDWFYMLDMYHRSTTEHPMVCKLSSILVLAKCASCKNVARQLYMGFIKSLKPRICIWILCNALFVLCSHLFSKGWACWYLNSVV